MTQAQALTVPSEKDSTGLQSQETAWTNKAFRELHPDRREAQVYAAGRRDDLSILVCVVAKLEDLLTSGEELLNGLS